MTTKQEKIGQFIQDVTNELSDAITASGKKFNEIKKSSIYDFLAKREVPKEMYDTIYNKLAGIPTPGNIKSKNVTFTEEYSSSINEVKKREPRKTIFGEIKKIS
jgi:predicted DNA-binding transcriptional regulator AlpA